MKKGGGDQTTTIFFVSGLKNLYALKASFTPRMTLVIKLLSFLIWKIWLARNKHIFQDIKSNPRKFTTMTWALVAKFIFSKGVNKIDNSLLKNEERT